MKINANLMDWRVHWIGANRAFKKFMDTGGAGNVNAIVVRFWNWNKVVRTAMDLILVHQIQRCHTFNAIWFHSYRGNQNPQKEFGRQKRNQNLGNVYDMIATVQSERWRKKRKKTSNLSILDRWVWSVYTQFYKIEQGIGRKTGNFRLLCV